MSSSTPVSSLSSPKLHTSTILSSSLPSKITSNSTSQVIMMNYPEDPYFLLRDRIELQMAKSISSKDVKTLEKDLLTLKQTIDSVLESPFLFPHINTSVELPQRMAFYQSMNARLAALKRGENFKSDKEITSEHLPTGSTTATTMTTTFHFEPTPDQHRQLDHLVSVVSSVKNQAHQISDELNSHKGWVSKIETHFAALDQNMERVSKKAVLAYRRSSKNDRAVMMTVVLLVLFLLFLAFI